MSAEKSYSQSIQTKFTKNQQTLNSVWFSDQSGVIKAVLGRLIFSVLRSKVVHVPESNPAEVDVVALQGSERRRYNSSHRNILQEVWKGKITPASYEESTFLSAP